MAPAVRSTPTSSLEAAGGETRRAYYIVDAPSDFSTPDAKAGSPRSAHSAPTAAVYFPRLKETDPLRDSQIGDFGACGAVAGVFARTDATRGVWKAPAGIEATLAGVQSLLGTR